MKIICIINIIYKLYIYIKMEDIPESIILSTKSNNMKFIKNFILTYQFPKNNTKFYKNYNTNGLQTIYSIYKLENELKENELTLIKSFLSISSDDSSIHFLDNSINITLKIYGLDNYDIHNIKMNLFEVV